ncbi:NADPH:quinone reductase [Nitzschia inconspicua]|uniref:NADPH:quinone reductase n=1 Tax=Nitzschia inconspicua TaxID=303405 RepID=A0A9K3L8H0_9STRA|nr:NADPH:quinone reductase [Nitzschia inconspicua]
MTAVGYSRHGDPFVLEMNSKYPRPVPRDDQVLLEVYATSVNPVDYKFRRHWMPNFLLPKPKIPGADVAGVVVEVGSNVTKFRKGDRCAALLPLLGSQWGSSAEFVAVRESHMTLIPDSISFVKAAALPLVALTAVQSFDHLTMERTKGKKILIQAGAGGVGTFAIQYAKNVLEMDVATTASPSNFKLVTALGADRVIDYHTEDFSELITDYDVVLDPMSWTYEHLTLNQGKNVLKNNGGHYLNILSSELVNGKEKTVGFTTLLNIVKHSIMNVFSPGSLAKYSLICVRPDGDGLARVFDLVDQGKISSVIDPQIFDLEELSDAHMYLERHYATGKVVVRVKQTQT